HAPPILARARFGADAPLVQAWLVARLNARQMRVTAPAHAVAAGVQNLLRAGAESCQTRAVAVRNGASPTALPSHAPAWHPLWLGSTSVKTLRPVVAVAPPRRHGRPSLLSAHGSAWPRLPPWPIPKLRPAVAPRSPGLCSLPKPPSISCDVPG